MTTRLLALVGVLLALCLVSACGGDDAGPDTTPAEALAAAKEKFDAAESIRFSLSTRDEPENGNGVLSATGTLARPPAFEGEAEVLFQGVRVTIPIVAVDGKVYAELPLTSGFNEIDPTEYGAPDPADFIDPQTGISTLLTELEGLEEEEQKRDGDRILSRYSGTLTGEQLKPIIPSAAEGEYDTVVGIDEDGRPRTVEATGPFFGAGTEVTYRISLTDYGKAVTITKP